MWWASESEGRQAQAVTASAPTTHQAERLTSKPLDLSILTHSSLISILTRHPSYTLDTIVY